MFGIVNPGAPKRSDARTLRTYRALSSALVDLMKTREFDAITVQDLLDRAGVGRATFYAHFRNKDDFLLTDLERMLAALESHFDLAARGTTRLAPIAELFDHLADAKQFVEALERSRKMEVVLDITSGHLARIIERRFRELGVPSRELPHNAARASSVRWRRSWRSGGWAGRRHSQRVTWTPAFTSWSGAGSARGRDLNDPTALTQRAQSFDNICSNAEDHRNDKKEEAIASFAA